MTSIQEKTTLTPPAHGKESSNRSRTSVAALKQTALNDIKKNFGILRRKYPDDPILGMITVNYQILDMIEKTTTPEPENENQLDIERTIQQTLLAEQTTETKRTLPPIGPSGRPKEPANR